MIDMGCLDFNEVIDIFFICMIGYYYFYVDRRYYGINFIEEVLVVVVYIGDIYYINIKLGFYFYFFCSRYNIVCIFMFCNIYWIVY